jgi:hypothetical protein
MKNIYNYFDKLVDRKFSSNITKATIHAVDGDRVDIRINNSPTVIRNVQVYGEASNFMNGQEVSILWIDGRPVVNQGSSNGTARLDMSINPINTPGTLSTITNNSASGSHTHAIQTSANPGISEAILRTDNFGRLILRILEAASLYIANILIDVAGSCESHILMYDGVKYAPARAGLVKQSLPLGETLEVPSGYCFIVGPYYDISGTIDLQGDLIVIGGGSV